MIFLINLDDSRPPAHHASMVVVGEDEDFGDVYTTTRGGVQMPDDRVAVMSMAPYDLEGTPALRYPQSVTARKGPLLSSLGW